MSSKAYARRQSFVKRDITITEEAVTEASRTFRASVQRLDSRITEEPTGALLCQ